MFTIKKKTEVETDGVAFTVPGNTELCTMPRFVCFRPGRVKFIVVCETKRQTGDIKQTILHYYQGPFDIYEPIKAIQINGLHGYEVTFGNLREDRYEAWFSIDPTEEGDNLFVFSIRTYHDDIEKVKASPMFQSLLTGIRKV